MIRCGDTDTKDPAAGPGGSVTADAGLTSPNTPTVNAATTASTLALITIPSAPFGPLGVEWTATS